MRIRRTTITYREEILLEVLKSL